jgi:hypothetical protein
VIRGSGASRSSEGCVGMGASRQAWRRRNNAQPLGGVHPMIT